MKSTMTNFSVAALAMISSGAMAAPVAIDTMYVATGSWNEGGSPSIPNPWTFSGNGSDLTAANNQTYGSPFTFFFNPVYIYSSDGTYAPYGGSPAAGGPTINGMVDAATGTITVDMSNWTMSWYSFNWNQGNSNVTGSWNSTTGAYNIAWSSTMLGGPFNGSTGNWSLQGTAVAVPEASTYGM